MPPEEASASHSAAAANPFTAADVAAILHERGWLAGEQTAGQLAWCERAAALLGGHAADRAELGELLRLVFHYDARQILNDVQAHAVLARYGARDVLRELAPHLLDPRVLDSDRLKEIITAMKERLELRGRELFHPIRLALAGRAGEGVLDRVILLLDSAAALGFAVPVKTARERMLEFCSALD
jgi:nondiscriminating glutamyl-tRNA synthetase